MSYLYLISCATMGTTYHKIGIANDVESRLAQLQTGNPLKLVIESCYEFPNSQAVETVLHQKYAQVRTLGEWFCLKPSQLDEFEKICTLLGGLPYVPNEEVSTPDAVEEAEEFAETAPGGKWDYAAMFTDGWCMESAHDGKIHDGQHRYDYWCWRKRKNGDNGYIYGGRIADLPYPSIEEMRRVYRDGKPVSEG